jgi:hypothetical protein
MYSMDCLYELDGLQFLLLLVLPCLADRQQSFTIVEGLALMCRRFPPFASAESGGFMRNRAMQRLQARRIWGNHWKSLFRRVLTADPLHTWTGESVMVGSASRDVMSWKPPALPSNNNDDPRPAVPARTQALSRGWSIL